MLTFEDIQNRLGITRTQLEILIYSGVMPPANIGDKWCQHRIEPFLEYLEARAKRARASHETRGEQCCINVNLSAK